MKFIILASSSIAMASAVGLGSTNFPRLISNGNGVVDTANALVTDASAKAVN
jgi:hypothetical protein